MLRLLRPAFFAAALTLFAQTPALAGSGCEALFVSMGRNFVPDAPPVTPRLQSPGEVLGCPADQLMQLVHDYTAVQRATAVTSRDQMVGTWVSDDVLGIYTGVYNPVYEVLEISAGEEEADLRLIQKLIRAADPAAYFAAGSQEMPPVDVAAAGRIATYGEHLAVLAGEGRLEPRRVRYHDFPLDLDRTSGIAMKTRYMAFAQLRPIDVRTDGDRLVFTFHERFAPDGRRTMTFRKRPAELPELALLISLVGELPMRHFHCFLEAMDAPTPGFEEALGATPADAFFAGLREAGQMAAEQEEITAAIRDSAEEEDRNALRDRLLALIDRHRELHETGPMKALRAAVASGGPFGCPKL